MIYSGFYDDESRVIFGQIGGSEFLNYSDFPICLPPFESTLHKFGEAGWWLRYKQKKHKSKGGYPIRATLTDNRSTLTTQFRSPWLIRSNDHAMEIFLKSNAFQWMSYALTNVDKKDRFVVVEPDLMTFLDNRNNEMYQSRLNNDQPKWPSNRI